MRLNGLNNNTVSDLVLREELYPGQEETLRQVADMIRQRGIDPDPWMRYITRDMGRTKSAGSMAFKEWMSKGSPGETKTGKAFGRKVEVTILEHSIRELINENFLGDIGRIIADKVSSLFDSGDAPEKVKEAISRNKRLSYIWYNFVPDQDKFIGDMEEFWSEVDEATDGKANQIRKIATAVFNRKSKVEESLGRPIYSLLEAVEGDDQLLATLKKLNVSPDTIAKLTDVIKKQQSGVGPRLNRAKQYVKGIPGAAVKGARDFTTRVAGEIKDTAKDAAKAVRGVGGINPALKNDNKSFAEMVIILADTFNDVAEADSPEEVMDVVSDNLDTDVADDKEQELRLKSDLESDASPSPSPAKAPSPSPAKAPSPSRRAAAAEERAMWGLS